MIFVFKDTTTTEIYTLSLHDALPISPMTTASSTSWWTLVLPGGMRMASPGPITDVDGLRNSSGRSGASPVPISLDRKSTRLNSSHANISYAGFCLEKNKIKQLDVSVV